MHKIKIDILEQNGGHCGPVWLKLATRGRAVIKFFVVSSAGTALRDVAVCQNPQYHCRGHVTRPCSSHGMHLDTCLMGRKRFGRGRFCLPC